MAKIYRGFSRPIESGVHCNNFLVTPRTRRDTPPEIHRFADAWFSSNFGVNARSQTLLCSTDPEQARRYAAVGSVAEILPSGPYSIIYSPNVTDFLDIMIEATDVTESAVVEWLACKGYVKVTSCDEISDQFRGELMVFCESFEAIVR